VQLEQAGLRHGDRVADPDLDVAELAIQSAYVGEEIAGSAGSNVGLRLPGMSSRERREIGANCANRVGLACRDHGLEERVEPVGAGTSNPARFDAEPMLRFLADASPPRGRARRATATDSGMRRSPRSRVRSSFRATRYSADSPGNASPVAVLSAGCPQATDLREGVRRPSPPIRSPA
jgi:hypothetical protein